jgi:hypothetical protein
MNQRRVNEDRTRVVSEDISRVDKISITTAAPIGKIETELKAMRTIK